MYEAMPHDLSFELLVVWIAKIRMPEYLQDMITRFK